MGRSIQVILFAITFSCAFFACEFFIKVTHAVNVASSEFYEDIGKGFRKNMRFVYFNEGFGIKRINQFRYIGNAYCPEKSPNTFRVALVGDSYVESFQVFDRDYFGTVAETILERTHQNQRFEFLNFGRSGFDIADMYAYQKNLVEKFDPDLVLYLLSIGDLEPKYLDPLCPKTIIESDSLRISFDFPRSAIRTFEEAKHFVQNYCIFNMLNHCYVKSRRTSVLSVLLGKVYYWFEPGKNTDELPEMNDENYEVNAVTKKIVGSLDPRMIIFVNRCNFKLPSRFVSLCENKGFTYFDLSEDLIAMKISGNDPDRWPITGKNGHWNQKGQKMVGEKMAGLVSQIIDKTESNLDQSDICTSSRTKE